jgi:hypothetical protein
MGCDIADSDGRARSISRSYSISSHCNRNSVPISVVATSAAHGETDSREGAE